ncbi:MAG: type II toxin-antitoxin system PemK/MazF family toxin [Gammaproteobacteria bacterium]
MKRGEVWTANLNPRRGHEIGKIRPVVIVQTDALTEAAMDTIIIIPITTQLWPSARSLRLPLPARDQLKRNSYVMVEKLTALDRDRIGEGPLATLTNEEMARVERSLLVVLGMYR